MSMSKHRMYAFGAKWKERKKKKIGKKEGT